MYTLSAIVHPQTCPPLKLKRLLTFPWLGGLSSLQRAQDSDSILIRLVRPKRSLHVEGIIAKHFHWSKSLTIGIKSFLTTFFAFPKSVVQPSSRQKLMGNQQQVQPQVGTGLTPKHKFNKSTEQFQNLLIV